MVNKQEVEKIQFRQIFASLIDGDFLIDVLYNYILSNIEYQKTLEEVFKLKSMDEDNGRVKYLLCKVIAAHHQSHCIMLNALERRSILKDEDYKLKLAFNVMIQIRIEPYNIQGLENANLFLNEPYVAPAIVYSNIIINAIASHRDFSKSEFKKNEVAFGLLHESCKSVASIMLLFQLGSYSQAITLYRNLLEQMTRLQILENHPESLNDYLKFCNYNIAYQREMPDKHFLKELEEKKIRKNWTQNFLLYGWLDSIEGYNHNYSFKSATDLFSDGGATYKLYEYASRFTHATHIGLNYNWENLKYYFVLNTISVFRFLAEVYRNYAGGKAEIVNGVDIYRLMVQGGDTLQGIVNFLGQKGQ